MRHTKFALALLTAAVLSACGGSSSEPGDQSTKVKFTSQVAFGDSLSDVGTYNVGTVAALKGGKFGINGDNTAVNSTLTGKNYTELLAAQLGLPAACAAYTGLDGNAAQGFSVPVVQHAGCYIYAQGGARVTNPVGIGNKLTGSALGALTVPVVKQVSNHLSLSGGKFSGTELVIVMAGANDVFVNLSQLSTAATAAGAAAGNTAGAAAFASSLVSQLAAGANNPQTAAVSIGAALQAESVRPGHTDATVVGAAVGAAVAAGNTAAGSPAVYGPYVATAQAAATTAGTAAGAKAGADYFAANAPALVTTMAGVANELATLVKEQVVAKGANYVVINNMPDIATTPFGRGQAASTQALIDNMVKTFNSTLASAVASESKILYVDTYAASHDQATNPAPYGLTNVSTPACNLSTTVNPLASSLACNGGNLVTGDVSHYSFADEVHPTPFVQLLLARYVSKYMVTKGWL
ncbi:MAG: hypothetical protein JWP59_1914 [Massilia sp.]|nr:hypothetical protein [Massilia sp.]